MRGVFLPRRCPIKWGMTESKSCMTSRRYDRSCTFFNGTSRRHLESARHLVIKRAARLFESAQSLAKFLSNEVRIDFLLGIRLRHARLLACINALEEPCHIAAQFLHNLHAFFVLQHIFRI